MKRAPPRANHTTQPKRPENLWGGSEMTRKAIVAKKPERDLRVWELREQGLSQHAIALEMGISRSLVAKIITTQIKIHSQTILDKIDDMRAQELAKYEETESVLLEQYAEFMASSNADPRDRFAASTKYAETLLKIIEAKRKLMGLDYVAPVAKTEAQSLEDVLMALPAPKGVDDTGN